MNGVKACRIPKDAGAETICSRCARMLPPGPAAKTPAAGKGEHRPLPGQWRGQG